MSDNNFSLNAVANLKEQPNRLTVHGSVLVYTAETDVQIEKAEVQGINPNILLLNLIITKKEGPMKGVPLHFVYEEVGEGISKYTQVQVTCNEGGNATVNITILG
jgi:hypothetical protein